jgi:hypothetical protein
MKYEFKIVLILGLILTSGISFEAGYLNAQGKGTASPLIVEKCSQEAQNCPGGADLTAKGKDTSATQNVPVDAEKCAFVGSKNSQKYHTAACRFVKNIKPENRVCFASKEEAEQKGRQPDASCVK